jgi:hypothetical protein
MRFQSKTPGPEASFSHVPAGRHSAAPHLFSPAVGWMGAVTRGGWAISWGFPQPSGEPSLCLFILILCRSRSLKAAGRPRAESGRPS